MKKIIFVLVISIVILGCSAPKMTSNDIAVEKAQVQRIVQKNAPKSTRKIIRSGQISITVETLRDMTDDFQILAEKYDGYVLSSNLHSATVRVASNQFDATVEEVAKWGDVHYKNINSEDVSEAYYNTKIRLDNAMKSRERYLQLLQQAKNVTDILAVEKELERLNTTIELLQGQLSKKDHLISYSTLSITMQEKFEGEKSQLGPLGYVVYGVYAGIRWLFIWD
ncbi:DUF4349 domain-containing protein [Candidatus Uabimicrobium sp. HlEnr_7]|uniref:DUF4349 domain-containing protein n=1 Tax=Candidatus Uabimicrobium helgolandensis TaxID=3095367 RepID=UPI003558ED3F